ncbi:outer membrane protein assembly factor BamC [Rheinheimera riviphila]|uniref:Outer membrane protein assembly factor BamC n=1 Tax=Rheinheimera riviphila TaxID=1834037 RepID=A0A437R349_9GAMM|nr:outer membrane protein assembly factor BamC [Rheinheimera riviphila]RVU41191.1 outer membrane protein assembly factor BamC [Rheinheimera riviphila]
MHYWISGSVLATLLLSGCSLWTTPEPTTATEIKKINELTIPKGLIAPRKPGQFDIPAAVAAGARGDAVELKAPMQVLAVSTNARVEEDDKEVRVFFERNEFTGDLMPYLTTNLNEFFTQNNIVVTAAGESNWQTDWISQFEETGWWLWESQELTQQSKFQVLLEPKIHGRTAALRVAMLQHQYSQAEQPITAIAQRREEVHFLNRMIDHLATVEMEKIRAAKASLPDVLLTRAVNEKDEAVLLTTQSIDVTWNQLELLFEQVSLTVTDLNRTDYVYYVNFTKPDAGFWGSIWGGEEQPVLPIAEGEYQLHLSKTDKGTAIKWRDKDGKALDQATVYAIYDVFVAAIRQAKLEL